MNQWLDGTRSLAMRVAGDAGSGLRGGLQNVSRMAGRMTDPRVLREGGRQVAQTVRRNPFTTATALVALLGAGVTLWALRRHQSGKPAPVEVKSTRVPRAANRGTRAMRKAPVHRAQTH